MVPLRRLAPSSPSAAPRLGGTWALLVGLALLTGSPATAEDVAFVIIVNRRNAADGLDRGTLARYFLKKSTRWPDDTPVLPVDLPGDSPVRARFSKGVLGRSAQSVKSYWQQLIFSGRGIPPPELDSDEAVVRYVEKHRGAIGYVSNQASLGQTKALTMH